MAMTKLSGSNCDKNLNLKKAWPKFGFKKGEYGRKKLIEKN
jgi:hypothetical protein